MAFNPFRRRRSDPDGAAADRFDPVSLPPGELADETEAYLEGRLADHYGHAGRKIPIWTLLNRLAHGTPEDVSELLTSMGHRGWRMHPSAAGWIVRERVLALRLLQAAPTPRELQRVQQAALIPVELQMIERNLISPVAPDEVADAATRALDDHLLDR